MGTRTTPKQLEFEFMKSIRLGAPCLYRMIGQCPNCTEDFDPSHHPNNLDCKRYHPIGAFYVYENK